MNLLNSDEKCSCHSRPAASGALPLAIATIPMQPWEQPYEACKALSCGTVFPSLDLPFYVTGGDCRG